MRWHFFSVSTVLVTLTCILAPEAARYSLGAEPPAIANPVYAFCFDTHDANKRDFAQQASMIKELGFNGVGHIGLEKIQERLDTLEEVSLSLFLAGVTIDLAREWPEQFEQIRNGLVPLKNRNVVIYVVLSGVPPADPAGNENAVNRLQALAELAGKMGLRIGIYPHTGDWVARADHAVRVARQVDRDNCGVILNLCHWLRNDDTEQLVSLLRDAKPYLVGVTINGADPAGRDDNNWGRLIQPLGEGSFDVPSFLSKLRSIQYTGPIGVMCYGIGGDAREHLTRSLTAYRRMTKQGE